MSLIVNRQFDGFDQFLEAAQGRSDMPDEERGSRSSSYFYGGSGWGEALRLALEGWPEGAQRVSGSAQFILSKVSGPGSIKVPAYAVAGYAPAVGRFLQGRPDAMLRHKAEERPKRVINIHASVSISASVNHAVIFTRGAAILTLIMALEAAGKSCSLEVGDYTGNKQGTGLYMLRVQIKRAGDRLDADRLAFALCHTAMCRRLGFSIMECEGPGIRRTFGVGRSYGWAAGLPPEQRAEFDIYMPQASWHSEQWRSEEAASAWVIQELARQGVQIAH